VRAITIDENMYVTIIVITLHITELIYRPMLPYIAILMNYTSCSTLYKKK